MVVEIWRGWEGLQWEWIASDRGTREKERRREERESGRAIEGTETRVGHEGR